MTFFIQATTGICGSLYSYCSVYLIIITISVSVFFIDIVRDINDDEIMAKINSTELREDYRWRGIRRHFGKGNNQ